MANAAALFRPRRPRPLGPPRHRAGARLIIRDRTMSLSRVAKTALNTVAQKMESADGFVPYERELIAAAFCAAADQVAPNPLPEMPITELHMTVRTTHCLLRAGIHTVGQLKRFSRIALMEIDGFGAVSANEVESIVPLPSASVSVSCLSTKWSLRAKLLAIAAELGVRQ